MNNIAQLLKTQKTVFSFQELKEILNIPTDRGLKSFLWRTKENKVLSNPYKGFRALPNYDTWELSYKMKTQSYISCETVLFKEGAFFQFYGNTISCINNRPYQYSIDGQLFIYHKIKDKILNNPIGIRDYKTYRIATLERALCDYIYLNPHGVIDAPESINKIRLNQILPFYPKKTALYIKKLLDVEY
jgi:hypothetical protein